MNPLLLLLLFVVARHAHAAVCDICGSGLEVTNFDAVVEITGQTLTPTCAELQQAGLDEIIPEGQCELVASFIFDTCGCAPAAAPTPPTPPVMAPPPSPMPVPNTQAPVAGDRTLAPSQTQVTPVNPPCKICGEGLVVKELDVIVTLPGFPITPTCLEFQQAGLEGQIPAYQCPSVPLLVTTLCGCILASEETSPPVVSESTSAPTVPMSQASPGPTAQNACFICGNEGFELTLPSATIDITGERMTCRQLEKLALGGGISQDQCSFVPLLASITCGCEGLSNSEPTAAPSIDPEICHVCGEGMVVGRRNALLEIPGRSLTCGDVEDRGLAGELAQGDCLLIPRTINETCVCVELPSPTSSPTCTQNDCREPPENNVSPSPSIGQSPSPTTVIVGEPSSAPTQPVPTPTVSPSDASSSPCRDGTGLIGDDTGTANQVEFLYEVITTPQTVTTALRDILTNTFEPAFSNALMSSLFSSICTRRLQARRRLGVIGLSAKPNDELVSTAACISETNGNKCTVIKGRFTLYATTGSDITDSKASALARIRVSMDNGAFDNLDLRLVAVHFRTEGLTADPGTDDSQKGETPTSDPAEPSAVPIFAWVLIGVGIAMLNAVICFFFWRRRRQAKELSEDGNDEYYGDGSNYQGQAAEYQQEQADYQDDGYPGRPEAHQPNGFSQQSYSGVGTADVKHMKQRGGSYSSQPLGDPRDAQHMMNSIGNL